MAEEPELQADDVRERASTRLERIAILLGCRVEDLSDRSTPTSDLNEVGELLRLWLNVQDPQTRRAVIEHLRQAAGEAPEPPQGDDCIDFLGTRLNSPGQPVMIDIGLLDRPRTEP